MTSLTGAPLGSLLGSHLHRLVLASFIYITDGVQFIGALVIVKPWSAEKTDTPLWEIWFGLYKEESKHLKNIEHIIKTLKIVVENILTSIEVKKCWNNFEDRKFWKIYCTELQTSWEHDIERGTFYLPRLPYPDFVRLCHIVRHHKRPIRSSCG